MAHLTHSVSRNNASVLSKTADKNLPILSNVIRHVPLRIIPVNSENATSLLKHDCTYKSPPTTPQTGSEIHREPRLRAHTIYMGENFLKSSVQFQTVRRPL